MPSDLGVREFTDALRVANDAVDLFEAKLSAALAEGRQTAARHLQDAFDKASEARFLAREQLIRGLVNPTGPKVASLTEATARLEARLERLRRSAARLNDLANILRIFTTAVTAFTRI